MTTFSYYTQSYYLKKRVAKKDFHNSKDLIKYHLHIKKQFVIKIIFFLLKSNKKPNMFNLIFYLFS